MIGETARPGFRKRKEEWKNKWAQCKSALRFVQFYRSFSLFCTLGICSLVTGLLLFFIVYFAVDTGQAKETIDSICYPFENETVFGVTPTVLRLAFPAGDGFRFTALVRQNSDSEDGNSVSEDNPEPLKTTVHDEEGTLLPETLYTYDKGDLQAGEHPVVPMDLSGSPQDGEILLSNATDLAVDAASFAEKAYPIPSQSGKKDPVVLIIHTHATECYMPEGETRYDEDTVQTRTADCTKNVVAVGDVMESVLTEMGIPTLHCTTLFDAQDYTAAYDNAAQSIREYIREYPTLQYVFDVHRDALCRENGDEIRPVTLYDGEAVAQVMTVVGTNEAGADHPDWRDHLTVAAHLQAALNEACPGLARPINLRSAAFNEQYTPGSLLLEVGSFGNTLQEAKRAAKLLAEQLGRLILAQ